MCCCVPLCRTRSSRPWLISVDLQRSPTLPRLRLSMKRWAKPMPPIFPRISATLIEPRIARILEKYALQLEDVFRGRDYLRRKAVSATEDDSAFKRVSGAIEAELNSLRPLC